MILPSKNLISKVLSNENVIPKNITLLNNEKLEIKYYCSLNEKYATNYNKNDINNYYVIKQNLYDYINIYKLANLCKEWAFKKGYMLLLYIPSYYDKDNKLTDLKYDCKIEEPYTNKPINYLKNYNTEFEAIFSACEWLLENDDLI